MRRIEIKLPEEHVISEEEFNILNTILKVVMEGLEHTKRKMSDYENLVVATCRMINKEDLPPEEWEAYEKLKNNEKLLCQKQAKTEEYSNEIDIIRVKLDILKGEMHKP